MASAGADGQRLAPKAALPRTAASSVYTLQSGKEKQKAT